MANHQIIIDATDTNNQPLKKTITNINPAASNEQLATFGTMLNAFTTNVYAGTTKITKTNCDTEPGGGEKPVPTLIVKKGDDTIIDGGSYSYPANQSAFFHCTYDGDGSLFVVNPPAGPVSVAKMESGTDFQVKTTTATTATISFGATESANYQYAPLITASFTFT